MTTATATKLTKAQSGAYGKLTSKSAKIRYLTSLSWSRRQIADHVGVIYQFVYNVQVRKLAADK